MVGLTLALSGCPTETGTGNPPPSAPGNPAQPGKGSDPLSGGEASPSPGPGQSANPLAPLLFASASPGESRVFSTWTNLVNGRISVRIRKAFDLTPVPLAVVNLQGGTPAWGMTDARGELVMAPLDAGRHVLRVQARGLVSREHVIENLVPGTPVTVALDLEEEPGPVLGRVVDAAGSPVQAALVSHPRGSAITAQDGTFLLSGLATGPVELSVQRGGFEHLTRRATVTEGPTDLGSFSLTASRTVVSVENPDQVVDRQAVGPTRTVQVALGPLAEASRLAGLTWGERLERATVRLVMAPSSSSLDAGTCDRLEDFVLSGGHLILAGEWGGAAGYSPAAMLNLTRRFGIGVEPSLFRPPGDDGSRVFSTTAIAPWLPLSGAATLRFRASGTLFLPPSGLILVQGPVGGYRIANLDVAGWPLVGMMAVGKGRVTLLADSSILTSGDEPGFDRGNQDFMIDLLRL